MPAYYPAQHGSLGPGVKGLARRLLDPQNPNSLGAIAGELVNPFVQFAQHPGFATGAGAAAAFPWGVKGTGPAQWDARVGGVIKRENPTGEFPGMDPTVYNWYPTGDPSRSPIGESHIYHEPDVNEIGYVNTPDTMVRSKLQPAPWIRDPLREAGLTPGHPVPQSLLFDLLAPALNQARVEGKPIDAQPINPKLALSLLRMHKTGKLPLTEGTVESSHQILEEAAFQALRTDPRAVEKFNRFARSGRMTPKQLKAALNQYTREYSNARLEQHH